MQLQSSFPSEPFTLRDRSPAASGVAARAPGSGSNLAGASESKTTAPSGGSPRGKQTANGVDKNTDPKVNALISELTRRDREVRAHEAAHAAVGGAYVRGGPSFSYTTGPDGKRYASGGEVQIDTSPIPDDPKATAQKMRVVKAAALAPAQPSGQDIAVAASASRTEAAAALTAAAARTSELRSTHLGTRIDRYG